jgi:hypothetical protein
VGQNSTVRPVLPRHQCGRADEGGFGITWAVRYGYRVRIGVLDIVAAGAFLFAAVMPSPPRPIKPLFWARDHAALVPQLAVAQAEVARRPADGEAGARFAALLVEVRQTDWAVRAAVRASRSDSGQRWRALLAASVAHVDRWEIREGLEWAEKTLEACHTPGASCPQHERARVELYERALRAAWESRIDPKVNPSGFHDAVNRAVPLIRLGTPE